MWEAILSEFKKTPSRLKVVELMLEYGISVNRTGLFIGEVELSVSKLAKAVGVDRKVVEITAENIRHNERLFNVFSRLKPVADLSDVARYDRTSFESVIEIHALSEGVGIASLVTRLLADEGICIRYMLAKDPELSVESTMVIVTDKRPPGRVVDILLRNKNIIKVSMS